MMTIHAKHRLLAAPTLFLAILSCCDVVGEEPAADQPGESIEFAIAGIIDLDDDGMSDVGELRSLIADHNGKVSAYCASDGTVVGKITRSTSYLIVGTPPEPGSKARSSFVQFISEAKKKGVEVIPLSGTELDSHASMEAILSEKPKPIIFNFGGATRNSRLRLDGASERAYIKITGVCGWCASPGNCSSIFDTDTRQTENEQSASPAPTVHIPNPFIRRYPNSRWNGW